MAVVNTIFGLIPWKARAVYSHSEHNLWTYILKDQFGSPRQSITELVSTIHGFTSPEIYDIPRQSMTGLVNTILGIIIS